MRGRGKQREQSKGRDGRSPPAGDSEPGPAEAPRLRREDGGPTGRKTLDYFYYVNFKDVLLVITFNTYAI